MQTPAQKIIDHVSELNLQPCPEPQQVMPAKPRWGRTKLVLGTFVDSMLLLLLLGGLLALPQWLLALQTY